MSLMKPSAHPPTWEVLLLVAHHLDPKTLAIASCVCKSWSISMSSDHLWKPICTTHYPSLATLRSINPSIPYHRLYSLGHISSKRRLRDPPKPCLSLHDLLFTIDVLEENSHILTIAKPGEDLNGHGNGLFRFDVKVCGENIGRIERSERIKVTWNVVLKGWRGVFSLMECKGKGRFAAGAEGWFSEELPSPGCCSNAVTSGLVADLGLGYCCGGEGDGRMRVVKVSMGVLSIVSWRYVSVDDALKYLQHFLLPSNA